MDSRKYVVLVKNKNRTKEIKDCTFKNNIYSNGQKKNDTYFMYLVKYYTSFDKWKKVVGRNAGTYQE